MKRWSLILALVLAPATARAQFTPAPYVLQQYFDNVGQVLNAGGMCVFVAGTSTLATSYATATGTANANPLLFNGAGRPSSGGFFLTPGSSYKLVLKDFTGVGVPTCIPDSGVTIWSIDNIQGVPSSASAVDVVATAGESITAGDVVFVSTGDGGLSPGQLYKTDADLTYKSVGVSLVGIAPESITSGSSGSVRINGAVTLSSPVTPGQPYYAGATPGALVLTPPTNAIRVGQAVSATSFVVGYTAAPVAPRGPPCGRLTLSSGVPVTTSDVTAATTVYYAPYGGCNTVWLFNGTAWSESAFAQLSIAVPATTSQMYDVFLYDNAGALTLELTAWTNDTTRATALTTQNGVYVKTGALTRLYLGSFRTTAVSGQAEDSKANRLLWNYYNRVDRNLQWLIATSSWTYTTATWRQANNSTANQVTLVVGVSEDAIEMECFVDSSDSSAAAQGVYAQCGIGIDSTTAPSGWQSLVSSALATGYTNYRGGYNGALAAGYHVLAQLEFSAVSGGTRTWYGGSGRAGIVSRHWRN